MRILFITRHFGCLRNFEAALKVLAARGHQVHLAALQEEAQGGFELVTRLAQSTPGITVGWTPSVETQHERDLARHVRLGIDYLRYLEPAYAATPRLKARAEERAPSAILALLRLPGLGTAPARRSLATALCRVEDALPQNQAIVDYLEAQRPDVALFTPLIGLGTPEVDYLSTARELGIRTVFCVWSWDNLSSKSILRDMPDAITVWNETQRHEAATFHNAPANRVLVTGAQCFDHWFGREPSRTREQFCAEVGLPSDRPFLLYVCSALFRGSLPEADFVSDWIDGLRASGDSRLRDIPILVRPHPARTGEWDNWTPRDHVVVWGSNPITAKARDDYFDSLYYGEVVVGLNTSAMLEAAVLDKPVLTVMLPEYAENQEGTLHFRYLLDPDHGLLHATRTIDDHVTNLVSVLDHPAAARARSRGFVEHFLRPCGLAVNATEKFVAAVEQVLAAPAQPALQRPSGAVSRWSVRMLERAFAHPSARLWLLGPREREQQARRDLHHREKKQKKLAHASARESRQAEKEAAKRERDRRHRESRGHKRRAQVKHALVQRVRRLLRAGSNS
ncbi:MAG TPA: hypothetical protein VNJ02_04980 [Vicinamibacterales bacterium]|nr:hypothetical protein [Vicinamibacterales bacterium]